MSEAEEKIIRVKANLVRVIFPRQGIGTNGNSWGITAWEVQQVEEGDVAMNYLREIIVKGNFEAGINPNAVYNIVAKEKFDDKYGLQYEVTYYNRDIDFSNVSNQRAFLREFLTDGQIEELYKVTDNPIDVISRHDIETLKKAKGIGDYISNKIIERFEDCKDMSPVFLALDNVGLSSKFVGKLRNRYGSPEKIIQVIQENPYQLVYDIDGVGFLTADKVALKSGFSTSDVRRIKAYITWYLTCQGDEGHSYVYASELMGSMYNALDGGDGLIETWIDEKTGKETNNINQAVKELENEGLIVMESAESKANRRIYLKKYWDLELKIAYHLKRLLNAHNDFVIEDFDRKILEAEQKQGFDFTQEQLDGIKLGLEKQVCVISGLAGTGKSSLVTGILAVLDKYTFAQTALSGKAAARLQEATGQEGYTIHRLLQYNGPTGFLYNQENPVPHHIIILDELSMVGGEIFLDLIEAIPTGSKLIMLGDDGQLPAIGLLNLIYDMINSDEIPTVKLKEVHRQAKASGILTTAYDVRNGIQLYGDIDHEEVEVRGDLKDMLIDTRVENDNDRRDVLAYFERSFNGPTVNQNIEKIQIICPVKERGEACVFNLNHDVQALVNPVDGTKPSIKIQRKPSASGKDMSFYIQKGDKVMCVKNNYSVFDTQGGRTAIYNGWTGIVDDIDFKHNEIIVNFTLGDLPVILPLKDIGNYLTLGYASTVHKMQGSSSDSLICVIDYSTPPQMLNQQMVYTMLTRAKKKCILVAQTGALRKAISTNYVPDKRTFLPEFIVKDFDEIKKMLKAS